MRFVELFAGAGGLSLGLERAGLACVGHAEIEPHARAVLRHHWPDVPLWGDVAQLTGRDFPACDLLSGGSPCQDLSVAGKRAGIVDGARSSLFFTQARLWTECGAPYLLWENVAGALSSNAGRDFALVLSTLVGAPIPVPRDGWAGGGVAAGPDAVAAWRVCDLRYFGVRGFGPPQRRVRVFVLAARAGGVDPAEVLALAAGVCGHPDPREAAGEGAAAEVGASVAGSLHALDGFGSYNGRQPTLRATGGDTGGGSEAIVVTGNHTHALTGEGCDASEDGTGRGTPTVVQTIVGTMVRNGDQHSGFRDGEGIVVQPLAFHATQEPIHGPDSPALGHDCGIGVVQPIVVTRGGFGDYQATTEVSAICARDAKDQSSIVVDRQVLANGSDIAATLTCAYADKQGLEDQHVNSGCPLFVLSSGQANASVNVDEAPTLPANNETPLVFVERPRRLMPLECERLMGWPDDHTARGVDENGKSYALKDTPRYRLCGNGVGSPVAEWIGRRLVEAIQAQQAEEAA